MKTELTTPKAILIGMSLVAVAIASIPYSTSVVTEAHAEYGLQKVQLCGYSSIRSELHCARVEEFGALKTSK